MIDRDNLDIQVKDVVEKTKDLVVELREHQEEYDRLDISQLETDGIIIKKGAWYLIPDMSKVPNSLKPLMNELKQDPKEKGVLVKISKKKSLFSKTIKQFEKLGF